MYLNTTNIEGFFSFPGEYPDSGMGSEPDRENSRDGADDDSDGENDDTISPDNTRKSSTTESPPANGCYVVSNKNLFFYFFSVICFNFLFFFNFSRILLLDQMKMVNSSGQELLRKLTDI